MRTRTAAGRLLPIVAVALLGALGAGCAHSGAGGGGAPRGAFFEGCADYLGYGPYSYGGWAYGRRHRVAALSAEVDDYGTPCGGWSTIALAQGPEAVVVARAAVVHGTPVRPRPHVIVRPGTGPDGGGSNVSASASPGSSSGSTVTLSSPRATVSAAPPSPPPAPAPASPPSSGPAVKAN